MRRIWRLSIAVTFWASASVIVATPASACSCEQRSDRAIIRGADAVLVGEVIGDRLVQDGTVQRVRVDQVFVGTLPPQIEVFAAIGPGTVDTCAVLFSGGHEVAMVLDEDQPGGLSQSVCSMVSVEAVRRLAGTPRPPDPDAVAPEPVPEGTGTIAAEDAILAWWQVVGLGALGAVGLIGGWLAVGRRRASDDAAPLPQDDPPSAPAG